MCIDNLISGGHIVKSNTLVVEVLKTHEQACSLIQQSQPGLSELIKTESKLIHDSYQQYTHTLDHILEDYSKQMDSYISICSEMEKIRNNLDRLDGILNCKQLASDFKEKRSLRKKLEEKHPFIRSYVKLFMAKQQQLTS